MSKPLCFGDYVEGDFILCGMCDDGLKKECINKKREKEGKFGGKK